MDIEIGEVYYQENYEEFVKILSVAEGTCWVKVQSVVDGNTGFLGWSQKSTLIESKELARILYE